MDAKVWIDSWGYGLLGVFLYIVVRNVSRTLFGDSTTKDQCSSHAVTGIVRCIRVRISRTVRCLRTVLYAHCGAYVASFDWTSFKKATPVFFDCERKI